MSAIHLVSPLYIGCRQESLSHPNLHPDDFPLLRSRVKPVLPTVIVILVAIASV